jgi:hypothetical protein
MFGDVVPAQLKTRVFFLFRRQIAIITSHHRLLFATALEVARDILLIFINKLIIA